jgi:AhpD family alkylhydroperoxidase
MQPRIALTKVATEAYQAMSALERYLAHSSLEHKLYLLVKLRASQMNGCAFCIDMHWKDIRAAGETEQRLYGLDAWRESPYYTDRERAALEWTESLTRIAETHAPDEVYESLKAHFTEQELADLTWAVAAINAWNRVAIGLRAVPGSYRPAHAAAAG